MTLDDADGYLDLELAGAAPVRLDLFEANDALCAALDGVTPETPPADYYARLRPAVARLLKRDDVSGYTAVRVKDAVFARVRDVRGKGREPQSAG